MENALSTIKLLPASKQELSTYIQKAKAEILSGVYNPLEVAGMLKAMEEITKALRDDKEIKQAIQSEADNYPEKTIKFGSYTITKSERKTKDYAGICPVLDDLNDSLDKTKAIIKARQLTIDSGVNPETGETFGPVPFITNSILSISLK